MSYCPHWRWLDVVLYERYSGGRVCFLDVGGRTQFCSLLCVLLLVVGVVLRVFCGGCDAYFFRGL